ncbi:hypothetical protein CC86DRAFT_373523, partial [Ophiobolus disseminans]
MAEVCVNQKLKALALTTVTVLSATHEHGPDGTNFANDTEPNQTEATIGDDDQTFADFRMDITEEDQALMCAQGHAAVYSRSRFPQHASWESTEADLMGMGSWAD